MLIIKDVYEKLSHCIDEVLTRVPVGEVFSASDVVDTYLEKWPDDERFMEDRKKEKPSGHSLRGYLDGMVQGPISTVYTGRIRHVGPKQYLRTAT